MEFGLVQNIFWYWCGGSSPQPPLPPGPTRTSPGGVCIKNCVTYQTTIEFHKQFDGLIKNTF